MQIFRPRRSDGVRRARGPVYSPVTPNLSREELMRRPLVLALSLSLAACTAGSDGAADSAAGAADSDADRQTAGGGVPAGYLARADREGTDLSGLSYAAQGGDAWEIT